MGRREELIKAADGDAVLLPLVDEVLFLEERMNETKKLPFIKVHPEDPTKQKATPAARQYREMLTQYTNIVKVFMRKQGIDVDAEESPLRRWLNENMDTR